MSETKGLYLIRTDLRFFILSKRREGDRREGGGGECGGRGVGTLS